MTKVKIFQLLVCGGIMALFPTHSYALRPSNDFMKAIVYAREGERPDQTERYGSFADFLKCLKVDGSSMSWEHQGNTWILHIKSKDALTKIASKKSLELFYDNKRPSVIVVSRILNNGVVSNNSISEMNKYSFCWDQPTWDTKSIISQSVKQATDIYHDSGMAGLKEEVETCYGNASAYTKKSNVRWLLLERCLGLDVSGHVIDLMAQKTNSFPPDSFFKKDSLRERTNCLDEFYPSKVMNDILEGVIAFVGQKM